MKSSSASKNTLYCTFCGKSQHEVQQLIAGPTAYICDECVGLCIMIIVEKGKNQMIDPVRIMLAPLEQKSENELSSNILLSEIMDALFGEGTSKVPLVSLRDFLQKVHMWVFDKAPDLTEAMKLRQKELGEMYKKLEWTTSEYRKDIRDITARIEMLQRTGGTKLLAEFPTKKTAET